MKLTLDYKAKEEECFLRQPAVLKKHTFQIFFFPNVCNLFLLLFKKMY